MASSPVKFLLAFLLVSAVGWIMFTFAARLLAWFLSRILGASVGFKVAGCNCLRDVNVKFNKGAIYSVSIGEIKLSLRKSLVKLGFSFISRDPKLQLLISDLEVTVRSSVPSSKSKSQRPRGIGRGKWMVLTNVARLLSVSVTELAIKVHKAAFEVKDLRVEMSKSGGPSPFLNIKLYLIPLLVQIWDSQPSLDQFSFDQWECSASTEKNCAPFICEDMSVASELCHDKNVMLRVNAKQGAPKDGNSPLELFQVEIYPLKIHLTEIMYRMMWGYFFPEEEQDSQRRQEVWKVSTTAGSRRAKKNAYNHEANPSSNHNTRETENTGRAVAAGYHVNASTSVNGESTQVSKLQSLKANIVCGSHPELGRTSSYDRMDENLADSVTYEPVLPVHNLSISARSGPLNPSLECQLSVTEDMSRSKSKDSKPIKSGRLSHEEKKIGKPHDEKRARSRRMMEFHNIKISQVELLVTYEGSRFAVNDLRLLMDTFQRDEFIGTWRRLFSRVKKHIIWGVLKSVTGMQGKKFKDKAQSQREGHVGVLPESDLNFSDSDGGQPGRFDQFPVSWLKRPSDGAGDGFVTSIRGLFNSQRRKAKAFVMRTMRGEAENEFHGDWSESDTEYPFARQLTITKAKKLIRRHTRKFRARAQKNSGAALQIRESHPSTPRETTPFQSDASGGSSYEDFNE